MNYATPDKAPICRCKDGSVLSPMFCPAGHLTECHFPLDCKQAACSHLPRYEEIDKSEMARLEELAEGNIRRMASPDCADCKGAGHTEVATTVQMPRLNIIGMSEITFVALAICPCVVVSDGGK